jgi:hypothetical protein
MPKAVSAQRSLNAMKMDLLRGSWFAAASKSLANAKY